MFRNIFIGVDGSPTGRDAIALARALRAPHARLTLAHVEPLFHASTHPFYTGPRVDSERLLEREREAMGVSAELISVAEQSVGRGLHELAETHAADLLVIGTCTRGLAGRIFVGDDTRASLNGARCAVAIAPRGYATKAVGFAAVGVGFNYSGESHAALAAARDLAAGYGAKLKALHVVSQPAYATRPPGDWGEILDAKRKDAEARLTSIEHVDGTAVYGVAGEELAAFGDRVDLLVIGSRSYGPVRRLVLGSTSNYLARHARCPLLVLPRAALTEVALSPTWARRSVSAGRVRSMPTPVAPVPPPERQRHDHWIRARRTRATRARGLGVVNSNSQTV